MNRNESFRLTRKVRVILAADSAAPGHSRSPTNNWLGTPTTDRLAPVVEICVTIAAPVDERTGYIEDIVIVDRLVHAAVQDVPPPSDSTTAASWLHELSQGMMQRYPHKANLVSVQLVMSPQWSYLFQQEYPSVVIMTRQYEFSAAHRLHSIKLSPEENRSLYGKCNNLHGHGHNYLLDVSLAGELHGHSGMLIPAAEMDRIVHDRVLAKLDHTFLNKEVAPFQDVNPTVENIARTIWDWLAAAFSPVRLHRIRLYETAKTWVDIEASS